MSELIRLDKSTVGNFLSAARVVSRDELGPDLFGPDADGNMGWRACSSDIQAFAMPSFNCGVEEPIDEAYALDIADKTQSSFGEAGDAGPPANEPNYDCDLFRPFWIGEAIRCANKSAGMPLHRDFRDYVSSLIAGAVEIGLNGHGLNEGQFLDTIPAGGSINSVDAARHLLRLWGNSAYSTLYPYTPVIHMPRQFMIDFFSEGLLYLEGDNVYLTEAKLAQMSFDNGYSRFLDSRSEQVRASKGLELSNANVNLPGTGEAWAYISSPVEVYIDNEDVLSTTLSDSLMNRINTIREFLVWTRLDPSHIWGMRIDGIDHK